jgi:hypothetical protein
MMLHFVDDDPGYLGWVAAHPAGYVVNTTRLPSAGYLMMHRATCPTITRPQPRATTFTGPWSTLCGDRDRTSRPGAGSSRDPARATGQRAIPRAAWSTQRRSSRRLTAA